MQWLTNDKIKHRVIGLAVLLSIALVFIPAMVKKSNQRLDEKMNLSLHLPKKPPFPAVAAVKPQVLFEAVKVAHVVLPEVIEKKGTVNIARAESLSGKTMADRSIIQKTPVLASKASKPAKPIQLAELGKPAKPAKPMLPANPTLPVKTTKSAKPAPLAKPKPAQSVKSTQSTRYSKPALASLKSPMMKKTTNTPEVQKKDLFSIQLGAFSEQNNAQSLVQALQRKGFKASYAKQGSQYHVIVGQIGPIEQARSLQKQLASANQMTGFIIKVA